MGYWENLIDIYESWDYDSLVDEAYTLSCAVRDDIANRFNTNYPLFDALMVAAYFMEADGMVDGAESSIIRDLFEGQPIDISGDVMYQSYKRGGWKPWVESYLRSCRGRALEAALRFGMVICASDGFIRDSEKRRILMWT